MWVFALNYFQIILRKWKQYKSDCAHSWSVCDLCCEFVETLSLNQATQPGFLQSAWNSAKPAWIEVNQWEPEWLPLWSDPGLQVWRTSKGVQSLFQGWTLAQCFPRKEIHQRGRMWARMKKGITLPRQATTVLPQQATTAMAERINASQINLSSKHLRLSLFS